MCALCTDLYTNTTSPECGYMPSVGVIRVTAYAHVIKGQSASSFWLVRTIQFSGQAADKFTRQNLQTSFVERAVATEKRAYVLHAA